MSLASAYLACLRIRRRQGWPLHRALPSAFIGAWSLRGMRRMLREWASPDPGHVRPVREVPEPEPWGSPYPVSTVLTTCDGQGRGCLVVKAVDEALRRLECQDTATGRRSTITPPQ